MCFCRILCINPAGLVVHRASLRCGPARWLSGAPMSKGLQDYERLLHFFREDKTELKHKTPIIDFVS
jgi:hypothetical protein